MTYGEKNHLQFNAAVRRVKATRFYARSHIPNFDLVSNTIKRSYIIYDRRVHYDKSFSIYSDYLFL